MIHTESIPREGMEAFSEDFQIVGKSLSMQKVYRFIHKVKDINAPVFISGESGTGKELVARNIHLMGTRRKENFVALNCGAIPENLLESELFGYRRGSFTGALRDKQGLIEEADKGILFLDEICDLSPMLQSKLLRVLQEKELRRIGENRPRPVDIKVISATNKDIEKEVEKERFREDLYYRLKIISIKLPPLKDRGCDILCLLEYFTQKFNKEMNLKKLRFSSEALDFLLHYSWPGNVRELKNTIERAIIFSKDKKISEKDLNIFENEMNSEKNIKFKNLTLKEVEKEYIKQVLKEMNGNKTKAAKRLGISIQTLYNKLKEF